MAEFNPQLQPTRAEEFLNLSKPISTVPVDKSKGMTLETIGQGIEGTVKLTDDLIKNTIRNDLTSQIDQRKEDFTTQLEQQAGVSKPSDSTNILPDGVTNSVPSEIKSGLNRIQNLQSAINNGAGDKINDTLYSGQINSIVKNMRSKYPGYRDYIDSEASKISGLPVANAYYKNLMQDINARNSLIRTEAEKPLNMLRSNINIPGAPEMIQAYMSGRVDANGVYRWIGRNLSIKYELDQRKAAREEFKGSRDVRAIVASDDASFEAYATVSNYFNNLVTASGQTVGNLIDSVTKGQVHLSSSDAQKLGVLIAGAKQKAREEILAKWNQGGANSMIAHLGGIKAANDILDQHFQRFDNMINLVTNKETGLAGFAARQNAGMIDDQRNGLYNDKELGDPTMKLKVVSEDWGPNWANTSLGQVILKNGIDTKVKNYFERKVIDATGGDIRFPPSFSKDITDGQGKNIRDPRYFSSLAGLSAGILDKQIGDKTKLNLVDYFFSPDNIGNLDKIQRDAIGPKGEKTVGADTFYQNLTSKAMTDEINRLGRIRSDAWVMYRNWAQDAFARLSRDDITTLAKISAGGVKVNFNPETHQLAITGLDKSNPYAFTQLGNLNYALQRLNSRLRNLAHVEESDGGDVNEFLLQVLKDNGFDGSGKNSALPDDIARKIQDTKLTPNQRINQGR
jgi:hypothetical protein